MKAYQEREAASRDRAAGSYDQWYATTKGRWFDRREAELFARLIRAHEKVLDLGAGTGRITASVAARSAITVALDFSLESLGCLRRKELPRVACVGGDASAGLPFRSGAFDAIVSCQVLQHLMGPDLAGAMSECRRVLKPDGRFYFAVYNLGYWRFRGTPEAAPDGDLYYRRFGPDTIQEIAAESRFSVKKIGYYKALPGKLPVRGLAERLTIGLDRVLCAAAVRRRISAYLLAELEPRN